MFCEEEFHLRSGGLQLASMACGFRERDEGFKVQVQELCSLLTKEVVICYWLFAGI